MLRIAINKFTFLSILQSQIFLIVENIKTPLCCFSWQFITDFFNCPCPWHRGWTWSLRFLPTQDIVISRSFVRSFCSLNFFQHSCFLFVHMQAGCSTHLQENEERIFLFHLDMNLSTIIWFRGLLYDRLAGKYQVSSPGFVLCPKSGMSLL